MTITTAYPSWLLIICLLIGFAYAYGLYYFKYNQEFSLILQRVLAFFRFITVSLLCFLLLNPFSKTQEKDIQKPKIILAFDNSQSILIGKDTKKKAKEIQQGITYISKELGDFYEVVPLSFGTSTHPIDSTLTFSDTETNGEELFDYISNSYLNDNIGAIIMASDGLFNTGINPLYKTDDITAPIYAIALGDTMLKKDLLITKVNHNKLCYLNNQTPIEIDISGKKCKNVVFQLTVSHNKKIAYSKKITCTSDDFFTTERCALKLPEKGVQQIQVSVSKVEKENTYLNNTYPIYIDVIDTKSKILVIGNSPHPDITAIKQTLLQEDIYEVEHLINPSQLPNVSDYNLVMIHGLPSKQYPSATLLHQLRNSKIPTLYIISTQTHTNTLSSHLKALQLGIKNQTFNEATALVNANFDLFTLKEETKNTLEQAPPLVVPYGKYSEMEGFQTLLFQKIGAIQTKQPLLQFGVDEDRKIGILYGEGLWKWKLFDAKQNKQSKHTAELITKTVQYLSLKEKKDPFMVYTKNKYATSEDVIIEAELYNESVELINTPEVNFTLTNEQGKKFTYLFTKRENNYSLNAGLLDAGKYSYIASTTLGKKTYQKKGVFTITAVQLEYLSTQANHQLVQSIAHKNQGKLFYLHQLDKLVEEIKSKEEITSISYSSFKSTPWINLLGVFILLCALLSTEWFLRKYNGQI